MRYTILNLERIDLYQLRTVDPDVPLEDSLGTLADLQAQGKIRHIGVSNFDVEQLTQAQKVVQVVSVQNRYNLEDRSSEDVLDFCTHAGIGFIPWFPLAAGSHARGTTQLEQTAQRLHATPSQVALAWLLKRSPVMLPIPGTSSVAHLEENVAAAQSMLSDDDFTALNNS